MEEPLEALMLALLLLAAVLVSSVIDQLVPKISSPLIQILLGLGIALLASSQIKIELDDKLFLVLFIAPLLYDEAKNIDKASLWRNRKPVLSLAIGLVLATALVVGFAVHWLVPSISLFAAFALGAALGPTDAVAVASLSKETSISSRSKSILEGESLINDASGIVAFQFAIAAAVTGTFSLVDATADFLFSFFGGILMGIALGYLGNFLVRKVRSWGLENTTFHVLFEVFTPFIVYLVANALHTSGILAVVAAGLVNVISPRIIGPSISRMNIVSGSVWHVLTYALNGIVFVLLGTQLPLAMQDTWENVRITNSTLILLVFGLTFVLLATRFLWVLAMDLFHVVRSEKRRFNKGDLRSALITTFCGAKGTITLSIMFSIPTYAVYGPPNVPFPQRELLIFLACGVIVCTLLLATFVVPLLAPARDKGEEELRRIDQDAATTMDIMREVIEMLTAQQTRENRAETRAVIRSYNDRLARIKANNGIESEMNVELRVQALMWEYERAMELMERGVVSGVVAYRYMGRLEQAMQLLQHGKGHGTLKRWNGRFRALWHRGVRAVLRELPGNTELAEQTEEMRWLQTATRTYAVEHLEAAVASSQVPTEDAAAVLVEYQRSVAALHDARPAVTSVIKAGDRTEDIKRKAYTFELEQIQSAYEDDRLSRAHAQRMRESVQLMQMDLEDSV